jgi:hypothetical protein
MRDFEGEEDFLETDKFDWEKELEKALCYADEDAESLLDSQLWPILWLLWEIESGDDDPIEDPSPATKAKKTVYKREWAWEFINSWSDDFFKRQYRVSREVFDDLCDRTKRLYPGAHEDGLENYKLSQIRSAASSANGQPITMELRIAITLRMLAGASYLDLVWYQVGSTTIHPLFISTLSLLDKAMPNEEMFKLPTDEAGWEEIAEEWRDIMKRKRGHPFMNGTVLAGDGLVIQIIKPSHKDRGDLDVAGFRNRKGYFALVVQAFCDAYGKFRYFDIRWPGATPDITCYKQTTLYELFMSGKVPEQYHMVLDEAYTSIGGSQHLCPYSRAQMRTAKDHVSEAEYEKMRVFCHLLSSQRITIERGFGMFLRKFGIMWRAMEFGIQTNTLIVMVCAKLHNLSIDDWKKKGKQADFIFQNQERRCGQREARNTAHEQWEDDEVELPTDEAVREMMHNYIRAPTRACPNDSDKRIALKEEMYNHGLSHHNCYENDYVLTA